MGARTLRTFIEQPLIDKEEIEKRLDGIEALLRQAMSRDEIREYLNPIYDLERLLGRVSYKTANPRDLLAFKNSLAMIPHIKGLLKDSVSPLLKTLGEELDPLEDLKEPGGAGDRGGAAHLDPGRRDDPGGLP